LEQFERAVRLSNDKYSLEAGTVSRRRQFIVAIGDQISRVEKATNDSKIENGSRGLNWVKLDEDEQNDLVAFLSAPAQLSRETRKREGSYHSPPRQKNVLVGANNHMDMAGISKDRRTSPMEISNVESEVRGLAEQLNVHRTNLSSSDEHWKINIGDDKDDERKLSPKRVEVSSKTTTLSGILKGTEYLTRMRWLRNSLWKSKSDEHLPLRYDVPNQLDLRGVTLLAQVQLLRLLRHNVEYYTSMSRDFCSRAPMITLFSKIRKSRLEVLKNVKENRDVLNNVSYKYAKA
jgi:hypothetical protein